MSTRPPELLPSAAAATTTWKKLIRVTTRNKTHARKEIAVLITRYKRLLSPSAVDFDLLWSMDLLAPEFIGLTIHQGKPQQIQLSIFVHLKLRESSRHVIQIDYRSELPSRHEASDENVAVPRHKLELCAACQKLHDQCIALQRDLGLAEAWIDELAGERRERRERSRIGRVGKQLRCLPGI